MKKLIFFLIIIFNYSSQFAQKLQIDSSAIQNWPLLGNPEISNDGNYVLYNINNYPFGGKTLIIQSADRVWKKEYVNVSDYFFSGNDKQVVLKRNDTLFLLQLNTDKVVTIGDVKSMKWSANKTWLSYQLDDLGHTLTVRSLLTNKEHLFTSVSHYQFNENGTALLINCEYRQPHERSSELFWLNLVDGSVKTIWSGSLPSHDSLSVSNYCFDELGTKLVFAVEKKQYGKFDRSIWIYEYPKISANLLVDNKTHGIDSFLISNSPLYFSQTGPWVFFRIVANKSRVQNQRIFSPDIWSYNDIDLRVARTQYEESNKYTVGLNTISKRLIRLEEEDDNLFAISSTGDYAIIYDHASSLEPWLESYAEKSYFLISLVDKSKKFIGRFGNTKSVSFSPLSRYLIYFDASEKQYFSYELLTNITRNITNTIPSKLENEYFFSEGKFGIPVGVGGWLERDERVIVYDNYDIWLVDPLGIKIPMSVTNGFGLANNLKFRLVYESNINSDHSSLLLSAFNILNKQNGFYLTSINKPGEPKLLTMGPYKYYRTRSQLPTFQEFDFPFVPRKAANSDKWIVQRMSATEFPNYFFTDNFRSFTPLSNLQPQLKYNWLTSELITWRQLDGTISQGILYKPEDFDPSRKYPIIFNYYEKLSYRLYEFPKPALTEDNINIPWFVSRGYLVFTPDIHYSIANISGKTTGDHVFNSVVSATEYLSSKPWVDTQKIGIQGHSFGGFQTYYLVTHTNMFAAGSASSGTSDLVSSYLSFSGPMGEPGGSRQSHIENSQGRMGGNLWDNTDLYIKNSPVYLADQVSTPLLIMHNKKDGAVPWGQGVEMFLALRRLGKKAWFLQYQGSAHSLSNRNDAMDFTIRLTQFFDYYLKGTTPPKWMTGTSNQRNKDGQTFEKDFSNSIP